MSLATYYAHRAPEMEEAYSVPERQTDLHWLREVLLRLAKGHHLLEIACGTGYWTQVMAMSASSIAAGDISEEMLALAKTKTYRPAKVFFRRVDAWDLEAVEGDYTAGAALFWWSHLPKSRLRPFLIQFHRALRPGALVIFADNLPADCRYTVPVRVDSEGNTYQRRVLRTGEVFEIIKNYPDEAEVRTVLSGLATEVEYASLNCLWLVTYRTVELPGAVSSQPSRPLDGAFTDSSSPKTTGPGKRTRAGG